MIAIHYSRFLFILFFLSARLWAQVPGTVVPEFGIQVMQSAWTCAKAIPMPNGRVLVCGDRNYKARVAQYTSTGALNPGFAISGVWSQATIDDVDVYDALLQADASLWILGTYEGFTPGRWLPWVTRLSANGQNTSPVNIQGPATGDQTVIKLVGCKGSFGDNLLAYTQGPFSSLGTTALRLFRINSEGLPSGGFPSVGVTLVPPSTAKLYELKALSEDSMGNLWAFGRITDFGAHPDSLFLAKMLANGTPDLSFGPGGFRRFAFFGGNITPAGLTSGSDSTVLFSASVDSVAFFVKLKVNGDFDQSFGTGGVAKKRFPDKGFLYDHTLLSDGRLVGCGTAFHPGFAYDYYLTCLKTNGKADTTFYDSSGTHIFGGSEYDLFLDIEQDGQGHLVVGGQSGPTFGSSLATVGKFFSTSTVEIQKRTEIKTPSLYPNPAEAWVNLKTESPLQSVQVTDALGRMKEMLPATHLQGRLDFSTLKPGMYWVRIQTADGTAVQKVVKK